MGVSQPNSPLRVVLCLTVLALGSPLRSAVGWERFCENQRPGSSDACQSKPSEGIGQSYLCSPSERSESHILLVQDTWWTSEKTPGTVFSSVQFIRSVVSDSLRPHEPQHARPPCPSPTAGVHPNPCPLSRWCHPTISSSVIPFSSCPQSFPASGSFPFWEKDYKKTPTESNINFCSLIIIKIEPK